MTKFKEINSNHYGILKQKCLNHSVFPQTCFVSTVYCIMFHVPVALSLCIILLCSLLLLCRPVSVCVSVMGPSQRVTAGRSGMFWSRFLDDKLLPAPLPQDMRSERKMGLASDGGGPDEWSAGDTISFTAAPADWQTRNELGLRRIKNPHLNQRFWNQTLTIRRVIPGSL